jgi:hypothetical protein
MALGDLELSGQAGRVAGVMAQTLYITRSQGRGRMVPPGCPEKPDSASIWRISLRTVLLYRLILDDTGLFPLAL